MVEIANKRVLAATEWLAFGYFNINHAGGSSMKKAEIRLARAGYFLLAVAFVFFFVAMILLAPNSNNPVEVMRVAGQASGVAGGVGVALIIADYLRRRKS